MLDPNRKHLVNSIFDARLTISREDDKYLRHSVYFVDPVDSTVWYGVIVKEKAEDTPTMEEIHQHMNRVNNEKVYPKQPAWATVAPFLTEDIHIKRRKLNTIDFNELDPDYTARLLLNELSVLEKIPPHPNIVKYHGCHIRNARITGIVLEQFPNTLRRTWLNTLDIPAFMAELQSAVDHIYSAGFVHTTTSTQTISWSSKDDLSWLISAPARVL